jgi:hypothetical protein
MDSHEDWWAADSARRAIKVQQRVDAPNEIDRDWLVRTAIFFWDEALKYGNLEIC